MSQNKPLIVQAYPVCSVAIGNKTMQPNRKFISSMRLLLKMNTRKYGNMYGTGIWAEVETV
jgi:hypothetical protein